MQMNNTFFYRPKEILPRQRTQVNKMIQTNMQKCFGQNKIINHLSTPASKIICLPNNIKQQPQSNKGMNHNNSKPANLAGNSLYYYPQGEVQMRQFLENNSPELIENKLNRSKSQRFIMKIPQNSLPTFQPIRPKGFTTFNSPSSTFNTSTQKVNVYQSPVSPKQIQKMQPIRRVSQHKSNTQQQSNKIARIQQNFNSKMKEQINQNHLEDYNVPISSNQNQLNFGIKPQIGQKVWQIPQNKQIIQTNNRQINEQTYQSNELKKNNEFLWKNGYNLQQQSNNHVQRHLKEAGKRHQSYKNTNSINQQTILLTTRRLIEQIFQNQTHKALTQIRLFQPRRE